MNFADYFPIWDKLTAAQQQISESHQPQGVPKGTVIHNGNLTWIGLLLIQTGQLRAFILSEEGREITIYRLSIWIYACSLPPAL